MKCKKCGYTWKQKVKKPKACPMCKQYTRYRKVKDDYNITQNI